MEFFHLLASLAFVYSSYSLIEYAVHRFLMHRMRMAKRLHSKVLESLCYKHMALHHKRDYKHSSDEPDDDILMVTIISFLPACTIGAAAYMVDPFTCKLMILFGMIYGAFWWFVHLEMHRAKGRFFSRTAIYRYLEMQHQLHHVYPSKNFNLLLPLGDWLFGTLPTKDERSKASLLIH